MENCYYKNQILQLKERAVFFDANILIHLFVPTGQEYFERTYSSIFGSLIKQINKLIIDFIVLSKFVNRVIRIDYKNYLLLNKLDESNLSYKKYRDSMDGKKN